MSVGAIVAARRHRERPPPLLEVSHERKEEIEKELKKRQELRALLKKYDTNNSGKLERDQVVKLLTDEDNTTPPGTAPSEEDVDFIIKLADKSGTGSLNQKEIEFALTAWRRYTAKKDEMHEKLKEFDVSGTGKLNKPELKLYLTSLNGGKLVSDAEVEWVLEEADVFGDEGIHANELIVATTVWFAHIDEKQAATCCTVQ
mmetsp:Transcript_24424/g.44282  ORF Transcript_24424/g.44282 Transcript_24424/m.44282 type:complete len:201 (+) Transcript_24424:51-653(+)